MRGYPIAAVWSCACVLVASAAPQLVAQAAPPDAAQVEQELKSSLRELLTAQERHYADHSTYTADIQSLDFSVGPDAHVVILLAHDRGWSGVISDGRVPGLRCAIWVGAPGAVPPPLADGAEEGEATCRRVVVPAGAVGIVLTRPPELVLR